MAVEKWQTEPGARAIWKRRRVSHQAILGKCPWAPTSATTVSTTQWEVVRGSRKGRKGAATASGSQNWVSPVGVSSQGAVLRMDPAPQRPLLEGLGDTCQSGCSKHPVFHGMLSKWAFPVNTREMFSKSLLERDFSQISTAPSHPPPPKMGMV